MRILIVALFILFSIRAQFFVNQIKRVEEALRTSEKGLATTLNAFGDAVITTDAEDLIWLSRT
jgi:PAS domain-containing protein